MSQHRSNLPDLRHQLSRRRSPIANGRNSGGQPCSSPNTDRPRGSHRSTLRETGRSDAADGRGNSFYHKRSRYDSDSSNHSIQAPHMRNSTATEDKRSRVPERDPAVLARRQKQIEYGKNTLSYQQYTTAVPRGERKHHHPRTPRKHFQMSRRGWDTLVKNWKIHLHMWDDPDALNKLRQMKSDSWTDDHYAPAERCSTPDTASESDTAPSPCSSRHNMLKRRCVSSPESENRHTNGSQNGNHSPNRENSDELDESPHEPLSYEDFDWAGDVEELAKLMD